MSVGKSIPRVDAYQKVTGRAMYADDLCPQNALVAKVIRSNIANGKVLSFDLSQALAVPGVVSIFTCFDVPEHSFATAGHPWSTDETHRDIADRRLLNQRVRVYGDDIAVVVAEDEVAAARAARLVQVTYEEYPVISDVNDAINSSGPPLHEKYPDNIIAHQKTTIGDSSFDEAIADEDVYLSDDTFDTQAVQHCHLEGAVSHAYMDGNRIHVISSTQIPHIMRRVISYALDISFGNVRVVKPYIGGGFGNKQDVLYEPLNAWLTMKLGGRCVKLELSREETMVCTRTRHAIRFAMKTAVRKSDGKLIARKFTAWSNNGGYASHGHAILANACGEFYPMYPQGNFECDAYTLYTNRTTAGAMRGYGIPQAAFAQESQMDDLALKLGMDPIDIRLTNCMQKGFVSPGTGITCHSSGLLECIEKGKTYIKWDEKRKQYQNQNGPIRRGVGMSIFCYKTGVYPISLETASCRIILNQDGSVQVQLGATEIGQGADTVFTQMAADAIGIPADNVHVLSYQDTDVTPFDTGAYASRQTYVSGMAVKETGAILKQKILDYAAGMCKISSDGLDIKDGQIVQKSDGKTIIPLADVAIESFYSLSNSKHITAEYTHHCTDNTFSFGTCFVEIEVDIPVGKVKILDIINVHDSGILINPQQAEAQIHGGMSMSLGYALSEQLLYDDNAKPLNDNLLDYKLPTIMDTPELSADFVQTEDPTGPFGNKSLGEPPAIPAAPAIRNAILCATGVPIYQLPMNPQNLVEAFCDAGLIQTKKGG